MKKQIQYMGIIALVSMMSVACSDINSDYDSIVPDNYHVIVSLKEPGLQQVSMSVGDGQYGYNIAVLKGGSHIDATVDLKVDALDQQYLDENYNDRIGSHYKVIPSSMYTFNDYHLTIPAGESGTAAKVLFDAEKIYRYSQREDNVGMTLILPVAIENASHQVNQERTVALLQIQVSPVVISFETEVNQVKLLDNVSTQTAGIVITKDSEFETPVHFDVMTQSYLDEHYSIPTGIKYVALTPDMYTMDADVVIPASGKFYTHNVELNIDKIKNYDGDGVLVLPLTMTSKSISAVVDRAETLVTFVSHEYGLKVLDNKNSWSVVYGTIAMPYGPYAAMFDGVEDGNGWMGHIDDLFPNSQNFGKPYVVIDLGREVMVGECAVQLGYLDGYYDTMPNEVEFYATNDDVDPQLTTVEWNLLNSKGDWGTENNISDSYQTLHDRLHQYDETVNWVKIGAITGVETRPEYCGTYSVQTPPSILNKNIRSRYIKVVLIRNAVTLTTANRCKIHELHVNYVSSIDGVAIY